MNNKFLTDNSSGINYPDIDKCTSSEQMIEWNEELLLDICSLENQIENDQGLEPEKKITAKRQALRVKQTLSKIIENRLNFINWKYE